MNLILMTNNSPKIQRLKDTETIGVLNSVVLKDAQDILNPIFIISGADDAEIQACNYCECPTLARVYFVNDIEFIRNGVYALHCHIDVLSTYAEELQTQSAIIRRQENDWNLYLNDGVFKVYQNALITTKEFTTGFSGLSYILAVAGN